MWLHLDLIASLQSSAKELFGCVEYAYTTIPTYPCGQIGFLISSLGGSSKKPRRTVAEALIESEVNSLRYYTEEVHSAAFVLPRFAKGKLDC
jgi:spermidine synthase